MTMHFRRRPSSSALEGYDSPTGESAQAPLQDPTWGQKPPVSSEVRYTRTPDRVLKERLKQAAPQPVEAPPVLDKRTEPPRTEAPRPVAPPVAAVNRIDVAQRAAPAQAPGVHFARTPTRMSPQ